MKLPLAVAFVGLMALPAHAQYYNQPYCREFTQTVMVGGMPQQGYGTACLQPDGAWQVRSFSPAVAQPVVYAPPPAVTYINYYEPRPAYYYTRPASSFHMSFLFSDRDYHRRGHWKGHGRGHHGGKHDRGRGHGRH